MMLAADKLLHTVLAKPAPRVRKAATALAGQSQEAMHEVLTCQRRYKDVIRQITLLRFKEDMSDTDVQAMGEGLAQLVDVVPGIHRFEFGPDLGLENDTFDYALIIDFDSVDVWQSYRAHPTHVAFAEKYVPRMEDIVRVQYRLPNV